MATASLTLRDMPDDLSEKYLPYTVTLRQRQKAKKFCVESYIYSVRLFAESDAEVSVTAHIFRSQKKTATGYKTVLTINKVTHLISDAYCECKAGISGECAHVLAVIMKLVDWMTEGLHDIPAQPASTSQPQQWDRPRGMKITSEPVSAMVIAKPGNSNRKRKPLTAVFTDNRKAPLQDSDLAETKTLKDCPLSYLTSGPLYTVNSAHGTHYLGSSLLHQLPLINDVDVMGSKTACGDLTLPKPTLLDLPSCIDSTRQKWVHLIIPQKEAEMLEKSTRLQSQSESWHKEREHRITASTFGSFMLRQSVMTEKFVKSLVSPKPFKSAATTYGTNSEKCAINMYRKKTGNHVHECGFVVNPSFPFLGATPDGIVCEKGESGILEVKCPFAIRDCVIKDAIQSNRNNLFVSECDGNIILKRNHKHWYQVQGQLLVTGANFCDFVTFTKCDIVIERIYPDKDTMNCLLNKLCEVYNNFAEII